MSRHQFNPLSLGGRPSPEHLLDLRAVHDPLLTGEAEHGHQAVPVAAAIGHTVEAAAPAENRQGAGLELQLVDGGVGGAGGQDG